jgi:hypothetical protein
LEDLLRKNLWRLEDVPSLSWLLITSLRLDADWSAKPAHRPSLDCEDETLTLLELTCTELVELVELDRCCTQVTLVRDQ